MDTNRFLHLSGTVFRQKWAVAMMRFCFCRHQPVGDFIFANPSIM